MQPAPVERAFAFAAEAYTAAGLPSGSLLISKEATQLLRDCGYQDRGLLCASMLFGTTVVGASLSSVAAHFGDYTANVVDELRHRPTAESAPGLTKPAKVVMLARVVAETLSRLETPENVLLGKTLAMSLGRYSKSDNALCTVFWKV